jgi:hypothetical protein
MGCIGAQARSGGLGEHFGDAELICRKAVEGATLLSPLLRLPSLKMRDNKVPPPEPFARCIGGRISPICSGEGKTSFVILHWKFLVACTG